MLKVCLALPVFYPTFGGGSLRFLRYQPGLRKRDIYSRVLAGTPRDKDDFHPIEYSDIPLDDPSYEPATKSRSTLHTIAFGEMLPIDEIEGLPIHRVRLATRTGVRRTSQYFRALIRHCKNPETRPDVIQLHSFERLESIYWLWRLRRLELPLIYASQIWHPIRARGNVARWFQRTMLRAFYNRFDGIVTNTSEISDRLRGLGVQTPIAVISNGVDLTRDRSCEDPDKRSTARRALGVVGSGPIILSVGAICPRKGADLLIEAWTKLLDENSQAELVLVGPRHDLNNPGLRDFRSKIEKLIDESRHPERVHLLGVVNDMDSVYAAADLVVLPSSREGMPNSVLEAMASERPVVLTPFLGQTPALGRPGFEFEQSERSASALARTIGRLLADPDRCQGLARQGRRFVEDTLDVEDSLDQLARFYRLAADRRLRKTTLRPLSESILFVTDRKFWRRSIGSEARIAALILHLARAGYSISVAYLGRLHGRDGHEAERFASAEENVEIIGRTPGESGSSGPVRSLEPFMQAIARMRKRATRTVLSSDFEAGSPARRNFVQRVLAEIRPRVVIVEFLRLTYTVYPRQAAGVGKEGHPSGDAFEHSPDPLYWIDTHDAMHERADRYHAADKTIPDPMTVEQETRLLSRYDTILAIQAREAALFRNLLPDKEVLLVPHGFHATGRRRDRPHPRPASTTRPIRLGFLGGRDVSNQHALEWFLETLWPALRARFGQHVELHVAGQICQRNRLRAPGLTYLGTVKCVERFWSQVEIAINPIQFGSGLKIKNVEAMASGCALLTTPIGAEGLEAASPDGLGIAKTEDEWKAILVHWLMNPDAMARVGQSGRAYADAHLSEEAAFSEIRTRLAEAISERAR